MDYLHKDLTEKIIGCFYRVYDELGGGFLESVYESALAIELNESGLLVESQKTLAVYYKQHLVGEFKADLIVEKKILIEIKAVGEMSNLFEAQLINYLKATGIKVGLLVNFGRKLEFRRRIF